MSELVEFCLNQATAAEIARHLSRCDSDFVPALSDRIDISDYAHKITEKAVRFEAWATAEVVGLVAVYCNDIERRAAYVTSVSVLRKWQGAGLASQLFERCIEYVTEMGFKCIELEVDCGNPNALRLYGRKGFEIDAVNKWVAIMRLKI